MRYYFVSYWRTMKRIETRIVSIVFESSSVQRTCSILSIPSSVCGVESEPLWSNFGRSSTLAPRLPPSPARATATLPVIAALCPALTLTHFAAGALAEDSTRESAPSTLDCKPVTEHTCAAHPIATAIAATLLQRTPRHAPGSKSLLFALGTPKSRHNRSKSFLAKARTQMSIEMDAAEMDYRNAQVKSRASPNPGCESPPRRSFFVDESEGLR